MKINISKLTLPYLTIPSLPSNFESQHINYGKFLRFRKLLIWLILLCKSGFDSQMQGIYFGGINAGIATLIL
jgi:hypothetical protein